MKVLRLCYRFSKIKQDKPDRTSWQHKVGKRADETAIKSLSQQIKGEKLEREKVPYNFLILFSYSPSNTLSTSYISHHPLCCSPALSYTLSFCSFPLPSPFLYRTIHSLFFLPLRLPSNSSNNVFPSHPFSTAAFRYSIRCRVCVSHTNRHSVSVILHALILCSIVYTVSLIHSAILCSVL